MGNYPYRLKAEFEIFGNRHEVELSGRWRDSGYGVDDSIMAWFGDCFAKAHARERELLDKQFEEQNAKELEHKERAHLAWLKKKYEE